MFHPPIFDSNEPRKIVNVKWDSQVAELINRNPNGPISGYRRSDKKEQEWYVHAVGPNKYIFRSVAHDHVYVNTHTHLNGVPLLGYTEAALWKLIAVDPAAATFRIVSTDGLYTWVLESEENYFAILLRSNEGWENKPEAHWRVVEP